MAAATSPSTGWRTQPVSASTPGPPAAAWRWERRRRSRTCGSEWRLRFPWSCVSFGMGKRSPAGREPLSSGGSASRASTGRKPGSRSPVRRAPGSTRLRSTCGRGTEPPAPHSSLRLVFSPGESNVLARLLPLLASMVIAAPVPAVPEALTIDGQPVSIRRDRYGVPHIIASSERAAYWADGYAIAEDRMAQMEKYRRAARGELAELVGSAALRSDEETRRESYTDAEREEMLSHVEPAVRASLEAYAEGVNAFLKARGDDLPAEVKKLGVPIRAWRAVDSLAIGEMMARRFGAEGGGELRNMLVLSYLKARF